MAVTQRPVGGWEPGLAPPSVEVEMEPEPAEGLAAARAGGWEEEDAG